MEADGGDCLQIFRSLRPGGMLSSNEHVCSAIQSAQHCIVEEIRPYRCSVSTIHSKIFEKLHEGAYLQHSFECPSACESPEALFRYIYPAHCGDLVKKVERDGDTESAKDGERCASLVDLVHCGRETLHKQGYCRVDQIEESVRNARDLFMSQMNIDPLKCVGNQFIHSQTDHTRT